MIYNRFVTTIKDDEGFCSEPYLDTVDVPTIGFGTCAYYPGDPVTMKDPAITEGVAQQLMQSDLYTALMDAQALFFTFPQMNDVRQEVVCNMAYNLGKGRLSGFKKMITACDQLDWNTAADEMIDSAWYEQVGTRSERLVAEMRSGKIIP